jgi:hypothetical protein
MLDVRMNAPTTRVAIRNLLVGKILMKNKSRDSFVNVMARMVKSSLI